MNIPLEKLRLCLLSFCLSLLAGCVTVVEEVEPLARAQLVVSRAGDQATLQFASEKGVVYQVVHAPTRNPPEGWKPLPGAERIVGTGELVQFKDQIPYRTQRYYRLKIIQITKK